MQERLAYWKATMEAEKNEERKAILKHLVTRISEQVEEEKKKVGGRHRRRRTLGRRARGRRGFKKFSKTRKHRK